MVSVVAFPPKPASRTPTPTTPNGAPSALLGMGMPWASVSGSPEKHGTDHWFLKAGTWQRECATSAGFVLFSITSGENQGTSP